MDIIFFFQGLFIGFLIAMPVGPIGVLCIQRTLTAGKIHGLVSCLGAATADAVYGFIVAFGLIFVSEFLTEQQMWFRIICGIFLCGLGIKSFLAKAVKRTGSVNGRSLASDYGSTFLLTLLNPIVLVALVAVFAGLGVTGLHWDSAKLLIPGIFTGSAIRWFILSGVAGVFHEKISHNNLLWLNRISGSIITTFSLLILLSLDHK